LQTQLTNQRDEVVFASASSYVQVLCGAWRSLLCNFNRRESTKK